MQSTQEKIYCHHCGDECRNELIESDGNFFCCNGCKTVNELLSDSDLESFYNESKLVNSNKQKRVNEGEFDFLEDKEVLSRLLDFEIEQRSGVTLHLPQIYCSACLYLLENLYRLDRGVTESKVNFLKKEITIFYNNQETSLKKIAELLTLLGFKPEFNFGSLSRKKTNPDRGFYIKLGIAFFSFGNAMLMYLPDYFSGGNIEEPLKTFMAILSILFAGASLYASTDYFRSAWAGLKVKTLNIDVPISIGISTLVIRSLYDIIILHQTGFVDSLAGLVFFLLLGKAFQKKTYERITFDRDFKSYFPLSVIKKNPDGERYVQIGSLKSGDRIVIRNNEIAPADSILMSSGALIDYSFVTGESTPVQVKNGEKIYAGGRLVGSSIELEIIREFRQSYLTELWNRYSDDNKVESNASKISDTIAKYFTFGVLLIAVGSFLYWVPQNLNVALNVVTAVLIVACPCALALTIPFTYGTALRKFASKQFFLKNDKIVEELAGIDTILLDKTGTLTMPDKAEIEFYGDSPDHFGFELIKSAVKNSTHPLSRLIRKQLDNFPEYPIEGFVEIPAKGLEAKILGHTVRIGSIGYVQSREIRPDDEKFRAESRVYVAIDGKSSGYFGIKPAYRSGLTRLAAELVSKHKVAVLSGDNDGERGILEEMLSPEIEMNFKMMPSDKADYVEKEHTSGRKVLMLGDGLNDSLALEKADIGIAVTDEATGFTPGAHAILQGDSLHYLSGFLKFAKKSVVTVYISYLISFGYNLIGFYFAVTGQLSPIVAAILMPLSSITVVLFCVGITNLNALSSKLNK